MRTVRRLLPASKWSVCLATLVLASMAFAQTPTFFLGPILSTSGVLGPTYGTSGLSPHSVAVGDLNGDGKPDLVVLNDCAVPDCEVAGNLVAVLLGNGDGTFQNAVTYGSGGLQGLSVAIADVNGDGKPDILVANASICCADGVVGVLLGNGDGTFQPAVSYSSGSDDTDSIAVADVNGDGKPDLLVASNCASCASGTSGTVGVLLGNGDGTFQPVVTYGSGGQLASFVAVADVNRDGKPDLLVVNNLACTNCAGSVGVLLGNGDGSFQPAVSYGSGGSSPASLAVGDLNGDGNPDLVVGSGCTGGPCSSSPVGVLLGNGDGTFQTATTFDPGVVPSTWVAMADVNSDGKLDLVVAGQCEAFNNCNTGGVAILPGNGDGTFQAPLSYTSGGFQATSVAVADLNGDGKPDIAVTNSCAAQPNPICGGSSVGILRNTTGLAATTTVLTSSENPAGFSWLVTFTATVSTLSGTPTGQVIFNVVGVTGNQTATVPLTNGQATFTTSFATGSSTVSATYVGDNTFAPSLATINQMVVMPVVTITGSPQQPLTTDSSGNFVAQVTITNAGNVTISSVQVTSATLGSGSLLSAPAPVTNLAPWASAVVTLTFPSNSVAPGATTARLILNGTYSVPSPTHGGSWGLSFRSVTL